MSRVRAAFSKIRPAEQAAFKEMQKVQNDNAISDLVFQEFAKETLAAAADRLVQEAKGIDERSLVFRVGQDGYAAMHLMHIEMQTDERHWLFPLKRYHFLLTYFQGCYVKWPSNLVAGDSLPVGTIAQNEDELCDHIGRWMSRPVTQALLRPQLSVVVAEFGTHPTLKPAKRLARACFWIAILAVLTRRLFFVN